MYVAGLAALAMRHIETARQQVRGGMEECGLREKPSRWVWCWEVREIVYIGNGVVVPLVILAS